MKPLGVLVNPIANRGGGSAVGEKVLAQLETLGIPTVVLSAETAATAAANAEAQIRAQGLHGIIAVGGDGTAQLGVNLCVPNQLPLGIIPAGSGNDQARELQLPLGDVEAAVALVVSKLQDPVRVDAMRVSTDSRDFWSIGSISGGFDALCAKRANGLKWPKGPNSYVAAMLLELPSFKPIKYRITLDGVSREIEAMLCGVANVKNFGGGMKISPFSDMQDGELELFILHKVSRPKLLRIFPTVYKGDHLKFKEIEIVRGKSIRIENAGFPVSCDGELVGNAPINVEVLPGALRVFA